MAANEERGEFEIVLDGAPYVMRPSWEAIQAFEPATGRSLLQLAADAERSSLSLSQCAIIVTECVRAWGKQEGITSARGFKAENVAPLLVEAGMFVIQPKLALMLYMAATGGLDASGKMKAALKNPKTADGAGSAGSPAPRSGGNRRTSGNPRP